MRRPAAAGPLALAALIVLGGALLVFRPFLTSEREVVTSTPGPPAIEPSTIPLEQGSEACFEEVTLEPRTEVVRLGLAAPAPRAPALTFSARGPGGYAARSEVPAGPRDVSVEVPLRPPPRELIGTLCVRNDGPGRQDLAARGEGRTTARVTVKIDGGEFPADPVLTLRRRAPASVASRPGELIDHAAAFVPLPPALVWLLGASVLLAVAGGGLLALRAAVGAPPQPPAAPPAPPPPLPLARRTAPLGRLASAGRARLERVPARVWLGLLVLAAVAWLYTWAGRVGTWQNDEEESVYLARWLGDNLPQGLWDFALFGRGLQRLEIFILALPLGTLASPAAFLAAHAVNVAIYASVAVPAYLLARGLGLAGRWALLASFVTLVTPWVVFATSFLTEAPAYGIWGWTLWATWRACMRPGVRSDLVALGFILVAALTRSGFLVLAPLLPAAAVLHQVRFGGLRRDIARRLWRRNPVAAVLIVAGVVTLAAYAAGAIPLDRLAGSYGTAINVSWVYADRVSQWAARIATGTGFVVFALGAPWILARAARPRSEADGGFALVALLMTGLLFFSTIPAGQDERYAFYLAVPLAVAAAAALGRRDLRPVAVALGGVFTAWLLWRHPWSNDAAGYSFFTGPAERFYARVFLLRLEGYLPAWLPVRTAALLLALALTALAAYGLSARRRARAVAVAIVAGLVVVQAAQAEYAMRRFVNDAGARFGPKLEDRAWVDRVLYGRERATIFATAFGNTGAFDANWREVQYWNTSVSTLALTGSRQVRTTVGDAVLSVAVDPTDGRIDAPLEPYVLTSRSYLDILPAGRRVAFAEYLPVDMLKLDQPPRARYVIAGPQPDGFTADRQRVDVRVFTAGLDPARRWCARLPLSVPFDEGPPGGAAFDVRAGDERTRGRIGAEQSRDVEVALGDVGRRAVDFTLTVRGDTLLHDGRKVALQLGQVQILECGSGG